MLSFISTVTSLPGTLGTKTPRIAIVGAGVIGLAVGVCLTETYGQQLDVTIIAEKFTPDNTSDRAGGIIVPYFVGGGADVEEVRRRFATTFDYFKRVHASMSSEKTGISLVRGYNISKAAHPIPWWFTENLLLDFTPLCRAEVKRLNGQCESGWSFATFVVDVKKYLPWMMERFQKSGGLIEKCKISNLDELNSYDVIVNCTGLGARELVGDDSVFPIRGQIVTVRAPKVTCYFETEDDTSMYVIPRSGMVILGKTAEPNVWSTEPDPTTAQEILERCRDFVPDLKEAEVIGGWACLRPGRKSVRLEVEERNRSPPVVHNYGHGGQGYALHWGCALDTVKLVCSCLEKREFNLPSKI